MTRIVFHLVTSCLFILTVAACPLEDRSHKLPLKNDIAVTAHPLATRAAVQMYELDGNAIDAAVAAAFALNVVEPHNSGLGGGGFMLIYLAATKKVIALDYRETSPQQAEETTYQNRSSTVGYAASGVPSQLRGLDYALTHYGGLPLSEVMKPALSLARDGFPVSPHLANRLMNRGNCLGRFPATRKIFFHRSQPLKVGTTLVQSDLAETFEKIAEHGPAAFYNGPIAKRITRAMEKQGGLIRRDDLTAYRAIERTPIKVPYRDYVIAAMPPPSSGGILLAQMFQMLRDDPMKAWGWASLKEAHLLAEVMKSAFADRARLLGDSDFVSIPVNLISPEYARHKRKQITIDKATPVELKLNTPKESSHTTHATFADHDGNIVAMTNSLNLPFGSCVVIPGTGILMNNHMDDFATRPDQPNTFGLIQGMANKVEAGKRPLSSMSPTIIFKKGHPVYALGSPGGPRIISNVFQVVVNLLDHGMTLAGAVTAPKLHHQYLPDLLYHQKDYPRATLEQIRRLGHHPHYSARWGNIQAIHLDWDAGRIEGVSDPRGEGSVSSLERLKAHDEVGKQPN